MINLLLAQAASTRTLTPIAIQLRFRANR